MRNNENLSFTLLSKKIGRQADTLRFTYGWNYSQISDYIMKTYNIDLAEFDELVYEHERGS
jgi:hypothetical protein